MGVVITTDDKGVKIKRFDKQSSNGNPFATYQITITKKDKNTGNWAYGGLDVRFRSGVSLNNNAIIKFGSGDAWLTFDEYNGKKYTKLFVNNFEIVEDGEPTKIQQTQTASSEFLAIPDGIDEELPFV